MLPKVPNSLQKYTLIYTPLQQDDIILQDVFCHKFPTVLKNADVKFNFENRVDLYRKA